MRAPPVPPTHPEHGMSPCMRLGSSGRAPSGIPNAHAWKSRKHRKYHAFLHASSTLLFDLGRTCEKRPYTLSFGGVPPPPNRGEHHEDQRPASGATGGSTKPENTANTVFFACFDTHLLSRHCRASTVSLIDTRSFGGVQPTRYAPMGEHHEPFIFLRWCRR